MNFAALVILVSLNKESWADAAEREDDTLPPLPMSWIKAPHEEDLWTTVSKKKSRGINNKSLGIKRK
jgi:hypothetical protein